MNARSKPLIETVWVAQSRETAKAAGALETSRGLMTRKGYPVLTWTEIRQGALRETWVSRWRSLDNSTPPDDVLKALDQVVTNTNDLTFTMAPPKVDQLVRWTDDAGATAYGRVQGIHGDGEKALYAVKGRQAGLVERVARRWTSTTSSRWRPGSRAESADDLPNQRRPTCRHAARRVASTAYRCRRALISSAGAG